MTTIRLDSDESLSGAIRSRVLSNDVFLVLKDDEGTTLWSGVIEQWSVDCQRTTTVRLQPTEERIEQLVQTHADLSRFKRIADARDKGLL